MLGESFKGAKKELLLCLLDACSGCETVRLEAERGDERTESAKAQEEEEEEEEDEEDTGAMNDLGTNGGRT